MKTFLNDISGSGYTFNAAAKTVTLTGLTTLTLDKILGIVNTTRDIVLYGHLPDWRVYLWALLCSVVTFYFGYGFFGRYRNVIVDVI